MAEELTDEQVGLYIAQGGERSRREFTEHVEAVRIGMVTAQDRRAAQRWRASLARLAPQSRPALSPAALEAAVMSFARRHPEYIAFGAA